MRTEFMPKQTYYWIFKGGAGRLLTESPGPKDITPDTIVFLTSFGGQMLYQPSENG